MAPKFFEMSTEAVREEAQKLRINLNSNLGISHMGLSKTDKTHLDKAIKFFSKVYIREEGERREEVTNRI